MKRIDLHEIHDQPWFPKGLRDDVTDTLQFILNFAKVYQPIVSRLSEAIETTECSTVIDLCSGGGGPWVRLQTAIAQSNPGSPEIYLTDKYPNIAAFERARKVSYGAIKYSEESIDATKIPQPLSGFRTMFSSFHHFPPKEAIAILQDAIDHGQGIGVFEAAGRRPVNIFVTFLIPLGVFAIVPFIRPLRWSRLIWTYVLPVIPFVLCFDGVISCLRSYSPSELSQLCTQLNADGYEWQIGEEAGSLVSITYLVGRPGG